METFVDGVIKENINSGNTSNSNNNGKDDTVASGDLPQTGIKNIISIVVIVMIICVICYIKYNNLKDIK